MTKEYSPYYDFDKDYIRGIEGEGEIKKILCGKLEVKTDFYTVLTGNICIEFESRGLPSGISTTEADWWVFNLVKMDMVLMINVYKLKALFNYFKKKDGFRELGDKKTSKCVLIPIDEMIKLLRRKNT